jgi:hypothetical protein
MTAREIIIAELAADKYNHWVRMIMEVRERESGPRRHEEDEDTKREGLSVYTMVAPDCT